MEHNHVVIFQMNKLPEANPDDKVKVGKSIKIMYLSLSLLIINKIVHHINTLI